MKNINDLDKALEKSLRDFSSEMQSEFNTSKGENLNKYDMDNLARQVFYMMDDFRKNIIKYLEDNKN